MIIKLQVFKTTTTLTFQKKKQVHDKIGELLA
jgi:hypothetical protein